MPNSLKHCKERPLSYFATGHPDGMIDILTNCVHDRWISICSILLSKNPYDLIQLL